MRSSPRPLRSSSGKSACRIACLKRRLQLDDELLEDLKEDLIYAEKLAIDEDGTGPGLGG